MQGSLQLTLTYLDPLRCQLMSPELKLWYGNDVFCSVYLQPCILNTGKNSFQVYVMSVACLLEEEYIIQMGDGTCGASPNAVQHPLECRTGGTKTNHTLVNVKNFSCVTKTATSLLSSGCSNGDTLTAGRA